MIVSQTQRNAWWNHFIERWAIGGRNPGHGVTGARLRKIKPAILADGEFWADVYLRHATSHSRNCHPEVLERESPEVYEHCTGNFWGMVYQELVERGLVG